jgi:hypothetical protein
MSWFRPLQVVVDWINKATMSSDFQEKNQKSLESVSKGMDKDIEPGLNPAPELPPLTLPEELSFPKFTVEKDQGWLRLSLWLPNLQPSRPIAPAQLPWDDMAKVPGKLHSVDPLPLATPDVVLQFCP